MSTTPTLFPFQHDWGQPFKVTREYLTDIQTATDGSEVRVQLRTTPAITMAMRCVFDIEQGAGKLISTWRNAVRPLLHYAPFWCDASDLGDAVTAGDAIIIVDTTTRPFFALNGAGAGYAMLYRSPDSAEVVSYSEVEDTMLMLDAGTVSSYAVAGTRVIPCRPMWLSMPVRVSWLSPVAAQAELSFFDLREQAQFGFTDDSATPVPATIHIYGGPGPGNFIAEAVVLDAGGIPIPSAAVEWSVFDNELADGIHVTPAMNTRYALVEAQTPSSTMTATSGAATITQTAS